MNFIIRYQKRNIILNGKEYYVTNLFNKLIHEIKNKFPEHSFEVKYDSKYENFGYGSIYSAMHISIYNEENENYILISLFDNWKYHFMKHLGWKPKKMKQFFYAGGFNHLDYFNFKKTLDRNLDLEFPNEIDTVYNSFFYNPYFDCCYDEMLKIKNNQTEKEKKLYFIGWMWDFRKKMVENINRNDILIIDKNHNNQNLDYLEYLNKMSKYVAALSLPGGTEICNRDIECFAIGVPVIRPHIQTIYPDPLIPNYHYINCYHSCDYSLDGNPKYLSYDDFKENLLYTWDKVKNDQEYLDFISKNASKWFYKNCTMQNNIDLILQKLNLNLLK
jgi:hypothetical protein